MALSSEADAGSREESASKRKMRAFPVHADRKGALNSSKTAHFLIQIAGNAPLLL
jgi:hypothetical protein